MAISDSPSPMPPIWTQSQVGRTKLGNLDTGKGLVLPHEPADLSIAGPVNFNDVPPIGGSGPRSVFSHTGATQVSFRVVYSRYHLAHITGDPYNAINTISDAMDWFESARFPVDMEDGWEGSAAPLIILTIPNVLSILCNLRQLTMAPKRDYRGRLLRNVIQCTFQETLFRRYTSNDILDVGMFRQDQ